MSRRGGEMGNGREISNIQGKEDNDDEGDKNYEERYKKETQRG